MAKLTNKQVKVLLKNVKEIDDVINNLEQLVESDNDLISRNLNDLWNIRNELLDLLEKDDFRYFIPKYFR